MTQLQIKNPAASVVVTGSELLSGKHRDTNTGYIERQLALMGIPTRFAATIGDRKEEMIAAFRYALEAAPILFVSGGLGPTVDDVTRDALSETLGVPLEFKQEVLDQIEDRFRSFKRKMTANNRLQAMVPVHGDYFPNPNGTAPGLVYEAENRLAIALPGPPRELEPMFDASVAPYLSGRFPDLETVSQVRVRLVGIGESNVDQVLRDQIRLDEDIELSILARLGLVDVTLSLKSTRPDEVRRLEGFRESILKHLSEYCYSTQINETIDEAVGKRLRERGETIGTAESCTGGLIASGLTSIPGSSDYVTGSFVTYSNESKQALLGVSRQTLETHGAVSESTVLEMAANAVERLGCTWSIAVSGIAGPGGGTEDKPVGLVWVGIGHRGSAPEAEHFQFAGNRTSIRERTRVCSLGKLLNRLSG